MTNEIANPSATPVQLERGLKDFDVLSFDCYGTLIDWESGIHAALKPLLSRVGANSSQPDGAAGERRGLSRTGVALSRDAVLEAFGRLEARQQNKTPEMVYPELLAAVHRKLAIEWDVAADPAEDAAFGRSIADWPAFPDTVEALRYLKQHFQLVILSNVDRSSFAATNDRLGVAFDAIYTAQDIGSYKPDRRNFLYLVDRVTEQGVQRKECCTSHRACSTTTCRHKRSVLPRPGSTASMMPAAGARPHRFHQTSATISDLPAWERWPTPIDWACSVTLASSWLAS